MVLYNIVVGVHSFEGLRITLRIRIRIHLFCFYFLLWTARTFLIAQTRPVGEGRGLCSMAKEFLTGRHHHCVLV